MHVREGNFRKYGLSLFAAVLLLNLTGAAKAETVFVANLDGLQTVPANTSAGKGFGIVTLNNAEDQITVAVRFSGLESNFSVMDIHTAGAVGQNGPTIFNLSVRGIPGTSRTSLQQTFQVTPQEVKQLRSGLWYFDIHSLGFPSGEIRGQILPYSPFVARLNSAQAVPATDSNGTGFVTICIDKTGTQVVISSFYAGLGSAPADMSINGPAFPGANAANQIELFRNQPTSRPLTITFHNITPQQLVLLKAGQLYLRVANPANPNGEIRGQIKPLQKQVDFDGDGRAEIAIVRTSEQPTQWCWLNSSNGQFQTFGHGNGEEKYVPADYDGDGLTDVADWNFTEPGAVFTVLRSSDNTIVSQQWGISISDVPVPADYDGDGKADFAVWRRETTILESYFWILGSNDAQIRVIQWGFNNDRPLIGDFDGDRISDITVVREELGGFTFYTRQSTDGAVRVVRWGQSMMHTPIVGDFDGDGKSDYAAFVQNGFQGGTAGDWWILGSDTGVSVLHWGLGSDILVPADYDGDGKVDVAIWRGVWWIRQSSDNAIRNEIFGVTGTDIPLIGSSF